MSFEDVQDQAAEDILALMGQEATYQPSVGDPVTVQVMLAEGVDLQPGWAESQAPARGKTIEALLSALGKEPDRTETFTIGTDVYTVQSVEETDGRFVKVIVKGP